MATYAVNVLFGLDMQDAVVMVEAANKLQAEHLALELVDHDGFWDFLGAECVEGEPDCEAHVVAAWANHRANFIGPAENLAFGA